MHRSSQIEQTPLFGTTLLPLLQGKNERSVAGSERKVHLQSAFHYSMSHMKSPNLSWAMVNDPGAALSVGLRSVVSAYSISSTCRLLLYMAQAESFLIHALKSFAHEPLCSMPLSSGSRNCRCHKRRLEDWSDTIVVGLGPGWSNAHQIPTLLNPVPPEFVWELPDCSSPKVCHGNIANSGTVKVEIRLCRFVVGQNLCSESLVSYCEWGVQWLKLLVS